MGSKVDITEHTQLVLMMHYAPELGSELALLLINIIYANCSDYYVRRINFIPTLENRLLIVAYGTIPGVLLMMMVLNNE